MTVWLGMLALVIVAGIIVMLLLLILRPGMDRWEN